MPVDREGQVLVVDVLPLRAEDAMLVAACLAEDCACSIKPFLDKVGATLTDELIEHTVDHRVLHGMGNVVMKKSELIKELKGELLVHLEESGHHTGIIFITPDSPAIGRKDGPGLLRLSIEEAIHNNE